MKRASVSDIEMMTYMAIQTEPRSTAFVNDVESREEVVYARHQWAGLALYGVLSCMAGLVYSRWDPGSTQSKWFWLIAGPLVGIVAIARSQSVFGDEGVDRDPGPYIGIFVGSTLGALVIAAFSFDGWILPGVFFIVAMFISFMAWLEQSGIGMSSAVSVSVVAAAVGIADLNDSVVSISLAIGLMLLSGSVALVIKSETD